MATPVPKTIVAICPECDTKIRFDVLPHLGEFVNCPECDTMLEVVQRSPLKLDWAFEDPFDDEDEYDDYDDDDEWFDDEDDYLDDEFDDEEEW